MKLKPDGDSALVLLALGGIRINERIQSRLDMLTTARAELPEVEQALAREAEELARLQLQEATEIYNVSR